MTTIVIAEDHHVVRQGIKLLLESEKDFKLLGEAADGLEAVKFVQKLKPNILLLDLMIPRLHGLEVIRQLAEDVPKTKLVVLSMHSDEPYVVEALRNGAVGYVLKNSTGTELINGLRKVIAGGRFLTSSLSERAIAGYLRKRGEGSLDIYDTLTTRERIVLQLTAEGHNSNEIGTQLYISPRTAETHRANLMRKLGLHSQTELVRFAIRKKIIAA